MTLEPDEAVAIEDQSDASREEQLIPATDKSDRVDLPPVKTSSEPQPSDPSTNVFASSQGVSSSPAKLAAVRDAGRFDVSAITAMQESGAMAAVAAQVMRDAGRIDMSAIASIPSLNETYGRFAFNDWSEALSRTLGRTKSPKARRKRNPAEFFAAFEGEVKSVQELLRALAVMQEKNSRLGLVWRGHQNSD